MVYVEKKGLPPAFLDQLIRLAAFQNPEFYSAQAMRFSTFGKPRVIASETLALSVELVELTTQNLIAFHGSRPRERLDAG